MTETRIRWQDDVLGSGEADGFTGTLAHPAFAIWKPPQAGGEWVLTSNLPGQEHDRSFDVAPDKLKAEAERWLAEFITSLGATFPAEPAKSRKSRAWHADWAEADRDQDGNAILKHKPTGALYRILPVEES